MFKKLLLLSLCLVYSSQHVIKKLDEDGDYELANQIKNKKRFWKMYFDATGYPQLDPKKAKENGAAAEARTKTIRIGDKLQHVIDAKTKKTIALNYVRMEDDQCVDK